jgi:NADH-quinone oxidoreductase subunit J
MSSVIYTLLLFLLFFGFFVISSRNPIHSVLSLISVFLLSAILLICLEVEFLAFSFVIVYVGAIAILFLFVVMMLDIKIGDSSLDLLKYGPLSYCLVFALVQEII